MKTPIIVGLLTTSLLTIEIANAATPRLSVLLNSSVNYQCADKTKLTVKYYSLSDKSLGFIKIKIGAQAEQTLPESISGSGAKFSDQRNLTWWTKGNKGDIYLSNDGPEDSWPLAHTECVALPYKK
jgi:membrane-bound inhibitor of C-type lysozyme